MKTFMDKDFLLQTETAQKLYNDYAAATPILDYHCHINPQEIYEDRQFENITQVWLGGDHYKWRFMRSCGVDERFITGNASDKEKFLKWAEVLGKAIGNPPHWSEPWAIPFTTGAIWSCRNISVITVCSTKTLLRKYGNSATSASPSRI